MKPKIKIFSGDTLSEGATIALQSKLYVIGWGMYHDLKEFTETSDTSEKQVAIAYIDNKPVACSCTIDDLFVVFVRKSMRRHGLARMLYFKCLKSSGRKRHYAMLTQSDRVVKFYKSLTENKHYEEISYKQENLQDIYDMLWRGVNKVKL